MIQRNLITFTLTALFMSTAVTACSQESQRTPADASPDAEGSPTDTSIHDNSVTDLPPDASADVEPDVALPEPSYLWTRGPDIPEWPQWVQDKPWATKISGWSSLMEHTPGKPAEIRHYSDLALGNGLVFSLTGYQGPVDRMHGMVGPGYQRGASFFSDTWMEVLKPSGKASAWRREWLGRLVNSPVVWSYSAEAALSVTSLTAAVAGEGLSPLHNAIIRVVLVRNRSDEPLDGATLVLRFGREQQADGDRVFEVQESTRRTVALLKGGTAVPGSKELTIALPTLQGGQEHELHIAYVMDRGDSQRDQSFQSLSEQDFSQLLAETDRWWSKRLAEATTIETPDPMVNEYLLQGLLVILAQTAHQGSICPMSQYTRFWVRDVAGPIRYLLRMGMFNDAKRTLDYLWAAILRSGGNKNSFEADIDPNPPLPDQPQWSTMPDLKGTARAETPSHVPLMHFWYWMSTGDASFLPERLEMMRYTLEKQAFEGDLLPFSGDETFRAAMAAAHGKPLTQEFVQGFYSSFSSLIWVVAANALADMYETQGNSPEATALRDRAVQVRAAAEETFRRPDGAMVPYVSSLDMSPSDKLFEDVSMKPIWFAYDAPDSTLARQNLAKSIEEIGGDDGILVTKLPDEYQGIMGLPIKDGVYTGMNPGYFLWNLAAAQHPLGETAFNAMEKHATPTGTHPEYQILDDHAPLHLLYSELGAEPSDYTARYRPWEGGINTEAVVHYLLGIQQDATTGTLHIAPHLPNGWSWLRAKGIKVGTSTVDIEIQRPEPHRWNITATRTSGPAVTLLLTLPPGPDSAPQVTINGAPTDATPADSGWNSKVHTLAPFLL